MTPRSERKEWPWGKACAFFTFLLLLCASPIEDVAHAWSSLGSPSGAPDFFAYYMGGSMARSKGHPNLYPAFAARRRDANYVPPPEATREQSTRLDGVQEWLPFVNPPFTALIMIPFASLPWRDAYLAWQLASILVTILALLFLFLTFSAQQSDLGTFAVLVAGAWSFHPFKMTINHGQFEAAMLLCWALGLYSYARRRVAVSAFWFALGTVTKVSPVVAVPLFVLRRQWRWLAAYAIWMVGLVGLSVWRLGWQNHILWLTNVYPTLTIPVELFVDRSLGGFLMALATPHALMGGRTWLLKG